MKILIKFGLTFVLGIVVTTSVLVPHFNQKLNAIENVTTQNIQNEVEKTVDVAVTEAIANAGMTEVETTSAIMEETVQEIETMNEPITETIQEVSSTVETTKETTVVTTESTTIETTEKPTVTITENTTAETTITTTVAPTTEPTQPTTKPIQPTTVAKPKPSEPEYFYEDGKKYTYINGFKTYVAPDDEPNVNQLGTYDWENDPAGKIPGNFR